MAASLPGRIDSTTTCFEATRAVSRADKDDESSSRSCEIVVKQESCEPVDCQSILTIVEEQGHIKCTFNSEQDRRHGVSSLRHQNSAGADTNQINVHPNDAGYPILTTQTNRGNATGCSDGHANDAVPYSSGRGNNHTTRCNPGAFPVHHDQPAPELFPSKAAFRGNIAGPHMPLRFGLEGLEATFNNPQYVGNHRGWHNDTVVSWDEEERARIFAQQAYLGYHQHLRGQYNGSDWLSWGNGSIPPYRHPFGHGYLGHPYAPPAPLHPYTPAASVGGHPRGNYGVRPVPTEATLPKISAVYSCRSPPHQTSEVSTPLATRSSNKKDIASRSVELSMLKHRHGTYPEQRRHLPTAILPERTSTTIQCDKTKLWFPDGYSSKCGNCEERFQTIDGMKTHFRQCNSVVITKTNARKTASCVSKKQQNLQKRKTPKSRPAAETSIPRADLLTGQINFVMSSPATGISTSSSTSRLPSSNCRTSLPDNPTSLVTHVRIENDEQETPMVADSQLGSYGSGENDEKQSDDDSSIPCQLNDNGIDMIFTCIVCKMEFKNVKSLDEHQRLLKCQKEELTLSSTQKAMLTPVSPKAANNCVSQVQKPQRFVCFKCGQTFKHRNSFWAHKRSHEAYECNTCHKKFRLCAVFERHKLMHEEGRALTLRKDYEMKCKASDISLSLQSLAKQDKESGTSEDEPVLSSAPTGNISPAARSDGDDICVVLPDGNTGHGHSLNGSKCSDDMMQETDVGKEKAVCDTSPLSVLPGGSGASVRNKLIPSKKRLNKQPTKLSPKKAKARTSIKSSKVLHGRTGGVKKAKKKKKKKNSSNISLTCKVCLKVFGTPGGLKCHMHCHIMKASCSICGMKFVTANELRIHRKCHAVVKCRECGNLFQGTEELAKHEAKSHGLVLKCTICKKSFESWDLLECHRKKDHETELWCDLCNLTFKTEEKLRSHQNMHERGFALPNRLLQCEICNETFAKPGYLKQHMRKHNHSPTCVYCKEKFSNHVTLMIHQKSNLQCKKSKDLAFRLKLNKNSQAHAHLIEHSYYQNRSPKTSHKARDKVAKTTEEPPDSDEGHFTSRLNTPYVCSECGKRHHSYTALDRHSATAHLVKPTCWQCGDCGKVFAKQQKLKSHVKTHTKPFLCIDCFKSFAQQGTLIGHRRLHSGERPYECTHCGDRFEIYISLRQHARTHMADKGYACSVCGMTFVYAVQLKHHSSIHGGHSPLDCNECGERCSDYDTLEAHRLSHYPGAVINTTGLDAVLNEPTANTVDRPPSNVIEIEVGARYDFESLKNRRLYGNVNSVVRFRSDLST